MVRYKLLYPYAIVSPKAMLSHVSLGKKSYVQGGVMLRNSVVGDYSYISGTEGGGISSHLNYTTIGKFCSLGHNLEVLPNKHQDAITTYPFFSSQNSFLYNKQDSDDTERGKVTIGNDVWIGANVTIVGSVNIGNGAIIGAGAVVTRDVPDYAVAVGVPARVIKYRFSPQEIKKLLSIAWWDWDTERIKKNIHILLSKKIKSL